MFDPGDLLDLDLYPITDPDRRMEVVDAAATQLAHNSVAVLNDFIRRDALEEMARDCEQLRPIAHRSNVISSPYLSAPDHSFPAGHPRNVSLRNALEVVAYDQIPESSGVRQLYEWDGLAHFVRDVMGLPAIYQYADPLGAINLATMTDGDELCWHFDKTDFVTSFAIAAPESGGAFEVAHSLRSGADEHYEDVAAVLSGDHTEVTSVEFAPGALMLFQGRNALHRVTPIGGNAPRHVALLAYDHSPGTDSTDELKLARYGRLPTPS